MEHEGGGDTNCNRHARYGHQRTGLGTGGFGNKRTNGDHRSDSIVEIGQNAEKSPGHLRRFAVTQTPVENYQLMP